jgi:hypothetical protein
MKEYRQIDASVEVPIAYLQYRHRALRLRLGRMWHEWGPGWTGSPILSALHPPTDGFDASYEARRWAARFAFSRLDDGPFSRPAGVTSSDLALAQAATDEAAIVQATADPTAAASRWLVAHRLEIDLRHNLQAGLTETAVVVADGAPPLWALNPLLPWSLTQQEHDDAAEEAGVLWALDLNWDANPRWSLYGQFLLDDFQIDEEDQKVHPDQLGWLGGVSWCSNEWGRPPEAPNRAAAEMEIHREIQRPDEPTFSAGLEYTRIGTWTYFHRHPSASYLAYGEPLGHPDGPDTEALSGFWQVASGQRRLLLLGRLARHGSNRLTNAESPQGHAGEPFPRPPVNRFAHVELVANWPLPLHSVIEARVGRIAPRHPGPGDPAGWYGYLLFTLPL